MLRQFMVRLITGAAIALAATVSGWAITSQLNEIPGGWVRRVVEAPSAPGTYYAASWNVYKSTDFGRTWTAKPYPLSTQNLDGTYDFTNFPRHITYDVAVCPDNADIAITGDQNGTPIWQTLDGGVTWSSHTLASDGIWRTVTMVSFSQTNSTRCFAAGRVLTDVNHHQGHVLYKSEDHGATWSALSSLSASANQTIMDAVQVSTGAANNRLVVAVIDQYYAFIGDTTRATTGRIYWSDDNGATFHQASSTFAPYKFAWDPTHGKIWCITSDGAIYASTDGNTWGTPVKPAETMSGTDPFVVFKLLYTSCGGTPRLFATGGGATKGRVYRSSGTFSEWELGTYPDAVVTIPEDGNYCGEFYDLVVDTRDATGRTYGVATTNGGFYYTSTDGGYYTQATGINTREIRYAARQGDRVFVNAFDNIIFGSTDGAKTWTQVAPLKGRSGGFGGGKQVFITLDPVDTGRVYLTDTGAIYVSTCNGLGNPDTGNSAFSLLSSPTSLPGNAAAYYWGFTNLLVHPSTPTVMFVGMATKAGAPEGYYLLKSTDAGHAWAPVTGLTTRGIQAMVFDPTNPDVIYAGAGTGFGSRPYNGSGDGLFKSTDGGETWTKLGSGILDQGYIETIAIDPEDPNWIWTGGVYASQASGASDGVYISTDGGTNWQTQLLDGHVINTSRIFYFSPFLYFGTSEGFLYKSDDRGETWGVAMLMSSPVEWLIDGSTVTAGGSPAIRRAVGGFFGALYAGSNSGMFHVTGIGPASGYAGGRAAAGGSGTITTPYGGSDVKSYAFPNPFNPRRDGTTHVRLTVPRGATTVTLKIYSLSGELVDETTASNVAAGTAVDYLWSGRNRQNGLCAPGLYFAVGDADGTKARSKIVLIY